MIAGVVLRSPRLRLLGAGLRLELAAAGKPVSAFDPLQMTPIYELDAGVEMLSKPATLTLSYQDQRPQQEDMLPLAVFRYIDGLWLRVGGVEALVIDRLAQLRLIEPVAPRPVDPAHPPEQVERLVPRLEGSGSQHEVFVRVVPPWPHVDVLLRRL